MRNLVLRQLVYTFQPYLTGVSSKNNRVGNKQQNVVTCVYHLTLHRKSLNKGTLLYIHLNLAIALLIALVIFVAGIETAITIPVSEVVL